MVGVKIDTLDYFTEYRVTITDNAMSVDSVRLDGDEDGEPGGEFEPTFKTKKPILNLTFTPSSHRFCPPGGSITGKIFIDGGELKKGICGRLNYIVRGKKKALEFSLLRSDFRVEPGESDTCGFRVISKGDTGSIYVTANPVFKRTLRGGICLYFV